MRRRPLLLAALGASAGSAATPWRIASGYSAEVFQTRNLQQFAQEAGNAGTAIEVHPNNTLVKLAEIPKAVAEGRVQAGEVIMSGLVKEVPAAGADAVPFIIGSYADARRLWQHQRPVMEEALAERGLMLLYAVPWPPQGLFTTRPITATTDLRGARMRTYNATTVRIAQLVGAKAVDVPMTGVAAALREGRIDSMITSAVTGVDGQVWDQLKYFYDIKAWFPKNLLLVNRAAWGALDEPVRQGLRRAAAAAEERGWAMSEAAAAASVATLARHGMRVETPGLELRNELRRFGERFSLEWVRETGRDANRIFIPFYSGSAHTR